VGATRPRLNRRRGGTSRAFVTSSRRVRNYWVRGISNLNVT
jgi:hypothetical protein